MISVSRFVSADFPADVIAKVLAAFRVVSGFTDFRPDQQLPCLVFNTGRNVFAILHTGAGKSLIVFTCIRLAHDDFQQQRLFSKNPEHALGVIVCPLQALVLQFQAVAKIKQLRACVIRGRGNTRPLTYQIRVYVTSLKFHGTLDDYEMKLTDIKAGMFEVIILCPESSELLFEHHAGRDFLVHSLIFDEAHCLLEHDNFRNYAKTSRYLHTIKDRQGFAPRVLCVSATLPPTTADYLSSKSCLDLREVAIIRGPSARANLQLCVKYAAGVIKDDVKQFIKLYRKAIADAEEIKGTCIIYCTTKNLCKDVAAALCSREPGLRIATYHAEVSPTSKYVFANYFITSLLRQIMFPLARHSS
jgi:superfamily II DNA helicase RecQ